MNFRKFAQSTGILSRRDARLRATKKASQRIHFNFMPDEMEKRQLLASFSYSLGLLTIQTDAANEQLSIVSTSQSGNYTITTSGIWSGSPVSGLSNTSSNLFVNQPSGLASILINDNCGTISNSSLNFGSSSANFVNNLSVSFTNATAGCITIGNTARFIGSSSVSLTGQKVIVTAGISTVDGNLSLTGVGATGTNNIYGVSVNGATVTTANGLLTINGTSCGTGSNAHGVYLDGAAVVLATGTGNISISANCARGGARSHGLYTQSSTIKTANGSIYINAISNGIGEDNGYLDGGSSLVSVDGTGSIIINATGSTVSHCTGANLRGRFTTANGDITLNGVARGTGNSHGVTLEGVTIIANGTGAVSVYGSGGRLANNNQDIHSWIGARIQANQITLTGNNIYFQHTDGNFTASSVTILTRGSGIQLGGGGSETQLGLTQADLNQFHTPNLTLGNVSTANISLASSVTWSSNISLYSGVPIVGTVSNSSHTFTQGSNTLTATGSISAIYSNLLEVTTNADSGAGSLRSAVAYAASHSGDDDITFNSSLLSSTITLATPITINDSSGNLTITGLGAGNLTIGGSSSLFSVQSNTTLTGLTFTNTLNSISNLTLSNVATSYSTAVTQTGGSLTINSSNVVNSVVIAGGADYTVVGGSLGSSVSISSGNQVSITGLTQDISLGTINAGGLTVTTDTTSNSISVTGPLALTGSGAMSLTGRNIVVTGDITSPGNTQTYTGNLISSGGNLTLTGSSIQITGTTDGGGNALTITGNLVSNGSMSNLTNLSVSGTSNLTGTVSTNGTQTFTGNLLVNGALTLLSNGNAVRVDGQVISPRGPSNLTSFTAVGNSTFTVPAGVTMVDVLIVAGGGGGTLDSGGGGGGGQVLDLSDVSVSGTVNVVVGDGGAGTFHTGGTPDRSGGAAGGNSTFGSYTAGGGGGGVSRWGNYNNGFTGGGGVQEGYSVKTGYGNISGGQGRGFTSTNGAGGGGGAGGNGASASSSSGGAGGIGISSSITGTPTYYGGGGGGSVDYFLSIPAGAGGLGGGGSGTGGLSGNLNGANGTVNTGGGGGGGTNVKNGGNGGSGIVIVRVNSSPILSSFTINAGAGSVALNGAVGAGTALTSMNITASNISLGSINATSLTLNSTASALSVSDAITVGGTANLTAAGDISLANATNNFGTVTACGTNITIVNSNATTLGRINASNLTVNSTGGNIIQASGTNLTVEGTGNFIATGNQVQLTNVTNSFGCLILSGSQVNLYTNGVLTLSAMNTGNLTVTGNGSLNQHTGSNLVITGTANFSVGGNVTLNNANNQFTGRIIATGNYVSITGTGGLNISSITANDLTLNTSGGNITQSGGIVVRNANTTYLTASNGNIILNNTTNNFVGGIYANATNDIQLYNSNATILGNIASTNFQMVSTGGGITQVSGTNITVSGLSNLVASGNSITIDNAGNDFSSTGNIAATGTSITFCNANATVLGLISASSLTVNSTGGGISQVAAATVTGNTSLTSSGNSIDVLNAGNNFGPGNISATGTAVSIRNANATVLGTISSTSLNVNSTGGNISQLVPLQNPGSTMLTASGNSILLTQSTNNLTTLQAMAGNLTLSELNNITLNNTNITGFVNITAADQIDITGSYSAANTLLNNGTISVSSLMTTNLTIANATANIQTGGNVTGATVLNSGSLTSNGTFGTLTVNNGTFYTLSNGTLARTAFSINNNATWIAGGSSLTDFSKITSPSITIGGNTNLTINIPQTMVYGQSLMLIDNTGGSAISGNFSGLPQNTTFVSNGSNPTVLKINYTGGSGNDLIVAVPSGTINVLTPNLTTTANGSFGNLTFRILGGVGNNTGIANVPITITLPANVNNCNIATGRFDNANSSNRSISVYTDINGNISVPIWASENPGPFQVNITQSDNASVYSYPYMGVIGVALQRQSINRSYIRYMDVILSEANLTALGYNPTNFRNNFTMTRTRSANNAGGANITDNNNYLTLNNPNVYTTPVGYTIDFGPGGLGNQPATSTYDGVYQLANANGATVVPANVPYTFHRLLGDANGDGTVNAIDTGLIQSVLTSGAWRYQNASNLTYVNGNMSATSTNPIAAFNWVGDLNGDGKINVLDLNISTFQRGRRVTYTRRVT